MDDLVNAISQLTKIPSRIECYDISNIFGKQATGSMVVAINGRLEKREYRRFKVKLKDSPDDYEMIREVLSRRFKREKSKSNTLKKWGRPDLVVIDGGKGQVSAATCVMEKYSLDIPVIGLAKRFETIVCADASETNLSRQSEGLKLLQRLRDEAHRFAKAYHLQLRLKNIRN